MLPHTPHATHACVFACVRVHFTFLVRSHSFGFPLCLLSHSLSLSLTACTISLKVLNSINIIFVDQRRCRRRLSLHFDQFY